MPRLPQHSPPLQEGPVRLRDAAERDIPEVLIAYEDDRQMHLRLFEERPPTGAALGRRAECEYADRAAGSRATLTVCADGSDLCVGQITVGRIDWEHARGELSMWIAVDWRGRGIGATALRLACTWLLERCGLERVQLLVEPDNVAMLRAAAHAGFVDEGILRRHLRQRGVRVDVAVLSLLRSDLGAS
jgi:RimJ/RimL family protein N-acetyltransferase